MRLIIVLFAIFFTKLSFSQDENITRFQKVMEKNQEIFYEIEVSIRNRIARLRELREISFSKNRYNRYEIGKLIQDNYFLLTKMKEVFLKNIDEVEKDGLIILNREEVLYKNEIWAKYQNWVFKTKERIESFITAEVQEVEKLERMASQFDIQFRKSET